MDWKKKCGPYHNQWGQDSWKPTQQKKGKLQVHWTVCFWVFDDRACRRHLCASQQSLGPLLQFSQWCQDVRLSRKSEKQHALKLRGDVVAVFIQPAPKKRSSFSAPGHLLFFCVLFTQTHLIPLSSWSYFGSLYLRSLRSLFFPHFSWPPYPLYSIPTPFNFPLSPFPFDWTACYSLQFYLTSYLAFVLQPANPYTSHRWTFLFSLMNLSCQTFLSPPTFSLHIICQSLLLFAWGQRGSHTALALSLSPSKLALNLT